MPEVQTVVSHLAQKIIGKVFLAGRIILKKIKLGGSGMVYCPKCQQVI